MSTFKFIARNVVHYYQQLGTTHASELRSEDRHLSVAGILDAWAYVTRGEITYGEIVQIAYASRHNVIRLSPEEVRLYDGLSALEATTDRLRNFILGLEALILASDNLRMDPAFILRAVKAKRVVIERTIDKAKRQRVPVLISAATEARWPSVDLARIDVELARLDKAV